MKKVFIIAGEASGDLYAKEIIKKLQNNNIEVFAMGSKNVQETQEEGHRYFCLPHGIDCSMCKRR